MGQSNVTCRLPQLPDAREFHSLDYLDTHYLSELSQPKGFNKFPQIPLQYCFVKDSAALTHLLLNLFSNSFIYNVKDTGHQSF